MTRSSRFNDVESAVSAAMHDPDIQNIGGFVIVHWQEWFFWFPTADPEASLATIVGATTSGVIVGRYRFTDAGWQGLSEQARGDGH